MGLAEPAAFTPMTIDPANPASTGSRAFQCYGRLSAGISLDSATAEMTVIASALQQQDRFNEGLGVFVSGLHVFLVREARPGLRLLTSVRVTLLTISFLNLSVHFMALG